MTIHFVLINSAPNREGEVWKALDSLSDKIEKDVLFGKYDLIIKIDPSKGFPTYDEILEEINSIPGIREMKMLKGICFA